MNIKTNECNNIHYDNMNINNNNINKHNNVNVRKKNIFNKLKKAYLPFNTS